MKKLKVCHVISAFGRFDTRIFYKQAMALKVAGYDVHIVTHDGFSDEEKNGIHIWHSGFKSDDGKIKRIVQGKKYAFKKALEINADIYQIHDPELISVGLKLRKRGKKIIYDSHENFSEQILQKEWIPKIFRKTLSCLANQYLKRTLKKYDAVLGVSPDQEKKLLEEYKIKEVKIITNYPLVENTPIPRIDFETYALRAKNISYMGAINRDWKNEYVIQATGELNFTLLLAGDGDRNYLESLKTQKYWKNVIFYGKIPFDKVNEIYNQSIAGVVLIDYLANCNYKLGTMGNNKLFENMKAGLPIICTDFILWREFIDRYKCGIYVNPNDYEQIKNAIKYIIDHPREAYDMGQNGITAVENEFNWNVQRETYLEVYKKIQKHD